MRQICIFILSCVCIINANTLIKASLVNKCPNIKHGLCKKQPSITAIYNWKTARGKISYSGTGINYGATITLEGYDMDGMYLGTIYTFDMDEGTNTVNFNEYTNELDKTFIKDVRKIVIVASSNYEPYIIMCKNGYHEENGQCIKDPMSLPSNCWGDPNGTSYCTYN